MHKSLLSKASTSAGPWLKASLRDLIDGDEGLCGEYSRQAALRENFFCVYAKFKWLLQDLFLGNQHGLCASFSHKASVLHGDGPCPCQGPCQGP